MIGPRTLVDWLGASLNRRLMAVLILALGALSGAALPVLVEVYHTQLTGAQARSAESFNQLLQATLENAMLTRDLDGLEAVLGNVVGSPGIRTARILNPALEVRFASQESLVGEVLNAGEIGQSEQALQPAYLSLAGTSATFRAVTPVANRDACRSCHGSIAERPFNGILVVDYDLSALGAEVRRGRVWLIGIGFLVILLTSATVGLAVSRTVIAPLARLSGAIAAMRRGEPMASSAIRTQDEIGFLSRSFHALAQDLDRSLGRVRASEAGLQAIIDAIPDGIRVIDRQYRVVMANAAYAAQVAMPLARVIGQPCHVLSYESQDPCAETLVRCPVTVLQGETTSLTCRQVHCTAGSVGRHVEIAAALVDFDNHDGSGHCVVEAIRDLNREVQLGQEHRLSELGMFAAGLAHEIHNPLNSIDFLIRGIELDLARDVRSTVDENLEMLHQEIERMQKLTESLLSLCMPSGEPQLLNLEPLIASALAILRYEFEVNNARLTVDVPHELRVLASDSDIRLSLTNLVLNALHAMPEGGEVGIRGWREADSILLEVRDTGHGIAPEDLTRIRLPFWSRRADGSAGRGLGLPLVLAALKRAGGRLEIESVPEHGSRFTLVYPNPDAVEGDNR